MSVRALTVLSVVAFCLTLSTSVRADQAPGAPGFGHIWAPALKQAVATAYEETGAQSPLWFTVSQGIVTEVFYPFVDSPQIGDMQLLISDGHGLFWEQKRDSISDVSYSGDGFSVVIRGRDRQGRFQFEQHLVTDPSHPVLRIHTRFQGLPQGAKVYVLLKPAINNSGVKDRGRVQGDSLVASSDQYYRNEPVALALTASPSFDVRSVGYFGSSDGYQQLSNGGSLNSAWDYAGPGSIAMTGQIPVSASGEFDVALGFGRYTDDAIGTTALSLLEKFDSVQTRYENGWKSYMAGLDAHLATENASGVLNGPESDVFRRSVQILKTHEDKRNRGAMVAALNKPGIPYRDQAPAENAGGYHLVWPRDLYHASIGLLAAGDVKTPLNTIRFLARMQKPDGSWPQNFWLDGTPYWQGLQMDQVAFPILLAEQLQRRGLITLDQSLRDMVRKAADFLRTRGPVTQQERWEEIGGYIPHVIAAEIAALRAASRLLNDTQYSDTARQWDDRLETWTLVPQGPYGQDYYLRTSPSGNPSVPEWITIGNDGGPALASEIIDGGFLELVRLGVRNFNAEPVLNTLSAYESAQLGITLTTVPARGNGPSGTLYGRYNHDRYGYGHTGGFWPLLGGERGEYALIAGDLPKAQAQLAAYQAAALPSGTIPEQLTRQGTPGIGVPAPLAWSHAGLLRLKRGLNDGKVFDFPASGPARSRIRGDR